jgi:very-short-patch-repair endonuclease
MRWTCRRHAVSRAFGDGKRSGRQRSRVNRRPSTASLGVLANASSPSSTAVNRASSLCGSPGFRRLIERAQDPELLIRILEDKEQRLQLVFERDVMRHLVRADDRVIPQRKAGSRSIDLAVEEDGHRLAIECDGDLFHPIEKLAEDMERQAILERLGWIFARIRGSVSIRDRSAR